MQDHTGHTRRIARNTMMLYFRMFFMMFLGLFTSRLVLEALGESDYGVYNVVGGVVAMFSLVSGALTTSVTRFITFEQGKVEGAQLNKVYSTAVNVQLILSLIVVLLTEPIGLWFIENEMTIDPSRIPEAKMVLHFSLLAFVINLMSVPQMASITAHEKMSAYAYIGILDGTLRLAVAIALMHITSSRLVWYAVMTSGVVLTVRAAYGIYCRRHFPECRYTPVFDKPLLKEMFAFAGWNTIGVASGVLRDQGGNLLVNVFSGVAGTAVNAARGLAVQLNAAVQAFVTNFMTAVNPQITKSYASGDHEYMFSLVRKSSRMAFYLLFMIVLPMLFNTDYLLGLWLGEVPAHTSAFVRLFLVFSLSESISHSLITAVFATGKVKYYQLVVGGLQLLNLPISYLFLHFGAAPEVTVVVSIVISQISFFVRLLMLRRQIDFSVISFITRVYLNVLSVSAVAVILPLVMNFLPCGQSGLMYFIANVAVCVLSAALAIFFVGCSKAERGELIGFVRRKFSRRKS